MNRYEIIEKLGEGTYGIVYKVKKLDCDKLFALKKIRSNVIKEGIPSTAIREITILKELRHHNIVSLLDVIHVDNEIVLVFEYMDLDLKRYLNKCGTTGINGPLLRSIMYQILEGLFFCHKNNILHRDLKPQNILINTDGYVKIADFGLAKSFILSTTSHSYDVVTLWYRAPDILLGSKLYSTPVDIWSLGCIFAEISNGSPLFSGNDEKSQIDLIFQVTGTPSEDNYPNLKTLSKYSDFIKVNYEPSDISLIVPNLCSDGIDLLKMMLKCNPSSRISCLEALKHKYFDPIRKLKSRLNESRK